MRKVILYLHYLHLPRLEISTYEIGKYFYLTLYVICRLMFQRLGNLKAYADSLSLEFTTWMGALQLLLESWKKKKVNFADRIFLNIFYPIIGCYYFQFSYISYFSSLQNGYQVEADGRKRSRHTRIFSS